MATQLRNLKLLFLNKRLKRIPIDGVARLRFIVWPHEIDVNLHLNNARYFSVADVGRFGYWLQAGWWGRLRQRGWDPVAGDANARFSRSLQPFERYVLETRLLGWDDKWFFVEHRFVSKGRVCAVVVVRFLMVTRKGPRPRPVEVLDMLGEATVSPTLPEWVAQWSHAQDQLSAQLKREAALPSSV